MRECTEKIERDIDTFTHQYIHRDTQTHRDTHTHTQTHSHTHTHTHLPSGNNPISNVF